MTDRVETTRIVEEGPVEGAARKPEEGDLTRATPTGDREVRIVENPGQGSLADQMAGQIGEEGLAP